MEAVLGVMKVPNKNKIPKRSTSSGSLGSSSSKNVLALCDAPANVPAGLEEVNSLEGHLATYIGKPCSSAGPQKIWKVGQV